MDLTDKTRNRLKRSGKTVRKRVPRSISWYTHAPYTDDPQAEYEQDCREQALDGLWTMRAPSWWYRQTGFIPARVLTRALLRKTLHLHDMEDAPLFPGKALSYPGYW